LDALQRKGLCLEKLGRNDESLKCYDEVLAYNPGNSEVWYNKGSLLNKAGQYDAAIACYDKALNPDTGIQVDEIGGELLEKLSVYESTLPCYPETPEFKSPTVKIWYEKALSFDKLEK